ncbi:SAF domain-containing protein [Streptomyces cellulosae]|uniref:SAF domain-containing protein n=1 Tax=Streptomyces althioticus TaxID=83380 RepID=A0ABZ1YGF5_9ACTN|nr:SAF domain-containing protein [Streptomyces cellulosae]WTB93404.1 SAF domain-containing protein [Streptomyces cellulosae]WTC60795.1 SAF domain-containing protein [Streptomyces cellulosae]
MSTTATNPAPEAAGVPAPRPLVRQPVVRRRRSSWIALGVALIAVSGAGGGWLWLATSDRESVVAVARDVPMGAELKAEDLVEARIATDPALKPVAADDLKKMIGKRTTVGLEQGSLLTASAVTDDPLVKEGEQLVGVTLSRLPATRLSPGQKVEAVHTPKESAAGGDENSKTERIQATVIEVGAADNSGDRVVDLAVNSLDGTTLAQWAADDAVTLVLVPASGS